MTRPEQIREWVSAQFPEHQVERVTQDLVDVATGNRPGNVWANQALASIFEVKRAERRLCRISDASVGHDYTAGDDGAYDLHDVRGTPEEVGAAITKSLLANQLSKGGEFDEKDPHIED